MSRTVKRSCINAILFCRRANMREAPVAHVAAPPPNTGTQAPGVCARQRRVAGLGSWPILPCYRWFPASIAEVALAAKAAGAVTCGRVTPSVRPSRTAQKLRSLPATGEGWLYELKFDGYRVQLHKAGLSSAIYGRNGGDFSRRFPGIAAAILGIPTISC